MFNNSYFTIDELERERSKTLGMQIRIPIVNTKDIPHTIDFLSKKIPSVLNTTCFNDENLPFHEEVKRTELGHLFEHILLDQMCFWKAKEGFDEVIFYGNTDWNWKENPYGFFRIYVSVKKKDFDIFNTSLNNTIDIFYNFLKQKKSMGGISPTHR